jgi:ubiquitin thioesterase protein OTUB1
MSTENLIDLHLTPLCTQSNEFSYENAQKRFQILCQSFPKACLRRVKGDGNCFLRAFIFCYLENALRSKESSAFFAQIHQKLFVEGIAMLQATGFQPLVYEDFMEPVQELLKDFESLSLSKLVEFFNDLRTSNSIVMFFRFLTSAFIRARQAYYENFINWEEFRTFEEFCNSVESLDKESDQLSIVALNEFLGGICCIFLLDNTPISECSEQIKLLFQSESPIMHFSPINLLYRPGHYDILYPESESCLIAT